MKRAIKRAAAAIALLLAVMLACSCMAMETGIIFKRDGTVRVYRDVTVDETLLENSGQTREEFFSSVSESDDAERFADWTREEIIRTVSDTTHIGIRYYKDCTCAELESVLSAVDDMGASYDIKNEGGRLKVIITASGGGNGSSEAYEYISNGMMDVKLRIFAPYATLETNGTRDEDGSVYWDLLPVMMGEEESLVMTIDYTFTDSETGIILKDNENARAYCDVTADEAALERMGQTKEDFIRLLSEDGDFEGWSKEEIAKTVSGANHIGVRYYKDCACEEIEQVFTAVNGSKVAWKVKNEEGKIEVKATVSDNKKSVIKIPEEITGSGTNAKFRISTPLELLDTNGTKDEDGSVYWDILPVMTGETTIIEMTASYKAAGLNLLLILCIAGGVVVVAGIIIAVVLLTKKKPAAPAPVPMGTIIGEQPEQQTVPAQQTAPAEQPAVAANFCKDCGAKIEEGSKFCINCGAKQD
ncbi:MAG: zinc ribbon domain-containing protein [Ruminiclostridium sp.]